MGLKGGSNVFFMVSAAQALAICLLHTFWSVIFFNAFDNSNYGHMAYVVGSHLLVSLLTLLNASELYMTSLVCNFCITLITISMAFKVSGGTLHSIKRFVLCQ